MPGGEPETPSNPSSASFRSRPRAFKGLPSASPVRCKNRRVSSAKALPTPPSDMARGSADSSPACADAMCVSSDIRVVGLAGVDGPVNEKGVDGRDEGVAGTDDSAAGLGEAGRSWIASSTFLFHVSILTSCTTLLRIYLSNSSAVMFDKPV